ncbi:MAG: FtsX-like permease family protein, partial [Bryobacteraceae bacterium]
RNGAHRPGRSVLCCALIASATFLIVSVEAFRRHGVADVRERKSGSGGYALVAESQMPLIGSTAVGEVSPGVSYVPLRLRPGDDASCLNLYQPRNPRILAASPEFARQGRFAFSSGDWTALDSAQPDGAVAAIADANSLTYVLHRKIGDTFEIATGSGGAVTLRFVAALADSIFQGEILIAERDFMRLFPDQQGYRVFLIEDAPGAEAELTANLEERFSDYGFDAVSTAARLAAFHRVENTYLSTFQTLGALGLLLGTIGLAALLVRNVLERRREMALLTAIGYSARRLGVIVLVEHAMLLVAGLVMGALAAALAVAPALAARAGGVSATSLVIMLAAVLAVGLAATVAATFAALRLPLLPALREGG